MTATLSPAPHRVQIGRRVRGERISRITAKSLSDIYYSSASIWISQDMPLTFAVDLT